MSNSLNWIFGGDISELKKSIGDDAPKIVKGFSDSASGQLASFKNYTGEVFSDIGKAILGAFAVQAIAGKLMEMGREVLDEAIIVKRMSEELDISQKAIYAFSEALEMLGMKGEDARTMMEKTKKNLDLLMEGSEGATKSFAKLHLTAKDFVGLNFAEAFFKISQRVTETAGETGNFSAQLEIMGKTSGRQREALKELAEQGYNKLGGSMATVKTLSGESIVAADLILKKAWELGKVLMAAGVVAVQFAASPMAAISTLSEGLAGAAGNADALGAKLKIVPKTASEIEVETKKALAAEDAMLATIIKQAERKTEMLGIDDKQQRALTKIGELYLQQYALAKEIADSSITQEDLEQKKAVAARLVSEIQKETNAYLKDQNTTNGNLLSAQLKLKDKQNELLEGQAKITALKKEEVEWGKLAGNMAVDLKTREEATIQVESLKKQIKAKTLELNKKINLTAAEEFEIYKLQAKLIKQGLNPEEQARLDILILQRKEKVNQAEIDEIMEKGSQGLTEEDKARLEVLIKQNDEYARQIDLIDGVVRKTKKVTTELERQSSLTTVGTNYNDQTTENLLFVQQQLKNSAGTLMASGGAYLKSSAYISGNLTTPAYDNIQTQLAEVDAELKKRTEVENLIKMYGSEAAAKAHYSGGPMAFDSLLSYIEDIQTTNPTQYIANQLSPGTTGATTTNNLLGNINTQLSTLLGGG